MHKFWSILFAVVNLAALGLFVAAPLNGWWLPANVSTYGPDVDYLFYLILAFTAFFFVLTEGILVYNMWRFGKPGGAKSAYVHGNHKLELTWTLVPAAILLFIAFAQVGAWERIKYNSRMPEPDQVFEVSARQFEWRVRYPTGAGLAEKGEVALKGWVDAPQADDLQVVNEVHTWKGAKVRFYLKTRDVLHSFFLPHLRVKQDAVPGRTIPVWFEANDSNTQYDEQTGTWRPVEGKTWELACAELCGWGHYKMQGQLYVHPDRADYERWLKSAIEQQKKTTP